MSFIAVPPAPQSPANTVVAADAFWPEVDCNQTREVLRLGDVVTHDRLVNALRGALAGVAGELRAWRVAREAEGATHLSEVEPEESIDGLSLLEIQFVRAVQFAAAAELAEQYRMVPATSEGNARADAQDLTAADYRRMSTHAVRDILGTTRTAVELI